MCLQHNRLLLYLPVLVSVILVYIINNYNVAVAQNTKSVCIATDDTIRGMSNWDKFYKQTKLIHILLY